MEKRSGICARWAGFSLVEVLIALAVAGILALGLVTAQGDALHTAARAEGLWGNINLAQTLLAGQDLGVCESYPSWVVWPDIPEASWTQEEGASSDFLPDEDTSGGKSKNEVVSRVCRLSTRVGEASMSWDRLVKASFHQ